MRELVPILNVPPVFAAGPELEPFAVAA